MSCWTHVYLYFEDLQYGLYLWRFPKEAGSGQFGKVDPGVTVWQSRMEKAKEKNMSLNS